jgi:hypothetical protein
MDGEEGNLHGEAGHEREQDQPAFVLIEREHAVTAVLGVRGECGDIEGAVFAAEINGAGERENRAGEGEEEEFDRRKPALRSAPDTDDEIHGDERELEEDVEKQQIAGEKDAKHRGQEHEHPGVIFLFAVLDAAETGGDGQGHQEHGEGAEEEADGIHAQIKVEADGVDGKMVAKNPAEFDLYGFAHLLGGGEVGEVLVKIELPEQADTAAEGDEADEQGPRFGGGGRERAANDGAGERDEEKKQEEVAQVNTRIKMTAMPKSIVTA